MIIDMHVHPPKKNSPLSLSDMAEAAKKCGIDRICLLGRVGETRANPSKNEIKSINNETMELALKYPEIYSGFCYLNPAHDEKFLQNEIKRSITAGPLLGIKLWVAVKYSDPRMNFIMKKALKLGIPVLVHAWYKSTEYHYNESTPLETAHLAGRFPDSVIIMAHLNGCGFRGVQDIKKFNNVFIETSGSQPESGMIEYAVSHLGAERVIFGSDAAGRDFSSQMGKILGAEITEREKLLILGENAKKILKL
ncbi:MAG: hypothetical protein A2096_17690 [Spirochaetes bacterium GWF1_41_5]|nr:MAG: hypothetical protein A2096_17690 [Spirochaetes bacterium GWF1_41_5]HBE02367.1 hypothetical protein [Spirochaetia bacterium]